MNNLIEEICNIIKNKKRNVRLLNIIYNLLAVHVKLLKLKGNTPQKNTKKIHMNDSMEPVAKKRFLEEIKIKYLTMDATNMKELLAQCNKKLVKARSVELCIDQFKRKISEGPDFICTICNGILYKKSVIICINKKYPYQSYFNIQQSFDGKQYICNTCHKKFMIGKLPCQAVVNEYVCG